MFNKFGLIRSVVFQAIGTQLYYAFRCIDSLTLTENQMILTP